MKVISGTLKGRTIQGYDIKGTRPTMDRVKESIFGMIQTHLQGKVVLDLFAGSGNLGVEAISNGAEFCYFVDKNPTATRTIQQNCERFQIQNQCKIINRSAQQALNYFEMNQITFDLVFLDPPYKDHIILETLELLLKKNLLKEQAIIVVEMEENNIGPMEVEGFQRLKTKRYGSKYVNLYQKQ